MFYPQFVVCRSSSTPGFASDSWDGYSWDAILGCRWFRFLSPTCRSHSYWILHLTQPCLWVAGPIFQPSYSWAACPCRWAGPIRVPCGPPGGCPYMPLLVLVPSSELYNSFMGFVCIYIYIYYIPICPTINLILPWAIGTIMWMQHNSDTPLRTGSHGPYIYIYIYI